MSNSERRLSLCINNNNNHLECGSRSTDDMVMIVSSSTRNLLSGTQRRSILLPRQGQQHSSKIQEKKVHFADEDDKEQEQQLQQHLVEVITYHDGPCTEEEVALVYDSRSEAQVLHEARKAYSVDASTMAFTQAMETLYHKKGNNRRCTVATATTARTTASGSHETTLKGLQLDHDDNNNKHHKDPYRILPRHFQWAIRTIATSEWRGLELLAAGHVIAAHRRKVVQSILRHYHDNNNNKKNNDTLAIMAMQETQQAAIIAMLLAKADQEQVMDTSSLLDVGTAKRHANVETTTSTRRQLIRNPAA